MTSNKQLHQILSELFSNQFHEEPKKIELLAASGSDRNYYRLSSETHTAIGVYSPDKNENRTFFYFTQLFHKNELPVPELYQTASNHQIYLIEDLGDQSLFGILEKEGQTENTKQLFKKSIDQLVRLHWQAGLQVDYSMCHASTVFDKQQIFADLLYFKYYFVDPLKVNYNKVELIKELEEWSESLASIRPQTFMYRDFQSRNIQVKGSEVFFIDYQGGMLGAPQYDLVSLLWQARALLPNTWKEELLNYYFESIKTQKFNPGFKENDFRKGYLDFVLLRILQTLGAYGFRGIIERKPHFLKSIQPALQQLRYFLEAYPHLPAFNEVRKVLVEIVKPEIEALFVTENKKTDNDLLHVHVYSFSYKKGIPEDVTGHGGGFVFDCRGILNPGRQEAYKTLTGKDLSVQRYLEQETKMPEFLESVFNVVDISIDDYLERKFDQLSVSFGCTGGQHRSVYAAETFAKHVFEKYGITAHVLHLEQEPNTMKRR